MSQFRSPAEKRAGTQQSVKALIAAAAISATLGGWALLSVGDGGASAAAAPPASIQAAAQDGQNPSGGQVPSTGQVPSFGGRHRSGQSGFQPFGGAAPNAQAPLPFARTRSSR